MSLSGRHPTAAARSARTIVLARIARLTGSHGRSKRLLDGAMRMHLKYKSHGHPEAGSYTGTT